MLDRTNRLAIGGNHPPSSMDLARGVIANIGEFLKANPVIENADQARAAKIEHDRAAAMVKDLEAERDAKVRPLNNKVAEINASYRPLRDPLQRIIDEIKRRVSAFARAETVKREAEAAAARAEAERLAQEAREAEAAEQNAIAEASLGVLDADVAGATVEADERFGAFQVAARTAARAQKDSRVRIGGGMGRVMTLRSKEVLSVTDACAAISDMGLTDHIREAILTSARAYRKEFGELPEGITATQDNSI